MAKKKRRLNITQTGRKDVDCQWLGQRTKEAVRLPSEAEWEYACRAGSATRFYCGHDAETLVKVGNVADGTVKKMFEDWDSTIAAEDGFVFTSPVGRFLPNRFGIYDMLGNAWEWSCQDWYGPYEVLNVKDPMRVVSIKDLGMVPVVGLEPTQENHRSRRFKKPLFAQETGL